LRNLEQQVSLIVPAAPVITLQGTPGAKTASYKIVAKDSNGNYTAASAAGTITTANDTLDGTNFPRLAWESDPAAASYDIYRTSFNGSSPGVNGLIGNVLSSSPLTFDDTGIVGDGSTAPTTGSDKIVTFGGDGSNYPIALNGGEFGFFRW